MTPDFQSCPSSGKSMDGLYLVQFRSSKFPSSLRFCLYFCKRERKAAAEGAFCEALLRVTERVSEESATRSHSGGATVLVVSHSSFLSSRIGSKSSRRSTGGDVAAPRSRPKYSPIAAQTTIAIDGPTISRFSDRLHHPRRKTSAITAALFVQLIGRSCRQSTGSSITCTTAAVLCHPCYSLIQEIRRQVSQARSLRVQV